MHLLIVGSTGRTGKYAYDYALRQGSSARSPPACIGIRRYRTKPLNNSFIGHHVTAIVRDSSALPPQDNLIVIQGSALSAKDVDSAFTSARKPIDAALQFLNHSGNSGPPRLLADISSILARALRQHRCGPGLDKPRLVIMNAVGAGQSYNAAPWFAKAMIRCHGGTVRIYIDHDAVDAETEKHCASEVRWTLAMAVGLQDSGIKHVKTFAVDKPGAGWFITRESCAQWMVDIAVGKLDDKFSNQRVIVSN